MKWKGIVSQSGNRIIATKFAIANATHASSTHLRRTKAPISAAPTIEAARASPTRPSNARPWFRSVKARLSNGGELVTGMPHGLDRRLRAELTAQPSHTDVDDVRSRIEVVAP